MCELSFDRGDVAVPDALEATIARKVAWLESVFPELEGCRVTVSGPARDHRHVPYRFRMALQVRHLNVAVCGHADNQAGAALSSALDAARRELEHRLSPKR